MTPETLLIASEEATHALDLHRTSIDYITVRLILLWDLLSRT